MNTIIKIENNKIYTESNLCEKKDVFTITDKILPNFFIWNIGENMGTEEYIPVTTQLYPNADKNDCEYYTINRNLLFAIKLPVGEVKLLREAAHNGITSLQEAEKALKSKRKGYWSDRKREHATKTIDIFRKITL
jgi:hypothetical protein